MVPLAPRRRHANFEQGQTLWAALIASLSIIVDAPPRQMIPQASALSQVFACEELLTEAEPEHLSSLVQSLVIPNAEFALTHKATHIQEVLEELIGLLRDKESEIYAQQGSGRRLHNAGALLWSSRWGWAAAPTGQAQSYVFGYINVELAAQNNPTIHECVDRLRQIMLALPPVRTASIVMSPGMVGSSASVASILQEGLTTNAAMAEQNASPSLPSEHP